MNNFEYLKSFDDVHSFWETIERLMNEPLYKHIDMEAFLSSEDNEPLNFLKTDGYCEVLPSEMELASALGKNATEKQKADYVEQHRKRMPVLSRNETRFGQPYVVVADTFYKQKVAVPACNVRFIDE